MLFTFNRQLRPLTSPWWQTINKNIHKDFRKSDAMLVVLGNTKNNGSLWKRMI